LSRSQYQSKLFKLFEKVQEENSSVDRLVREAAEEAGDTGLPVTCDDIRRAFFSGVDKVILRRHDQKKRQKYWIPKSDRVSFTMSLQSEAEAPMQAASEQELTEGLPLKQVFVQIQSFEMPSEHVPDDHYFKVCYG